MAFLVACRFSHLNRIPEGSFPFAICAAIFCRSFIDLDLPKLLGLEVLRIVFLIVLVMLPPPLLVRYGVEWQVLNSKDFCVPQSRRRVYIVGYLNANCAGKILPFRETNDAAPAALRDGAQGNRVYDPAGVSCTLSASCGGFGGRTGLYDVSGGVPIKEATKKGYKMAYPGDSIDLAYPQMNTRRGRVGRQIAHTLTTDATQGTLTFIDLNADPRQTKLARCINTRQDAGIHKHRGECSGVLDGKRIRRLTPRECLRLQGWQDEQIDKVLAIQSDNQVYKQAGNGVTVTVVKAIGRRLAAVHKELEE